MIDLLLNTIALDPNRWTPDHTPYFTLDALLPPIAEAGFTGVECWQYHLSTASPAQVAAYARRGRDLGLSFPVVGAYPVLHLQGAAGARAWEALQRLLEHAVLMEAKVLKLFVGNQPFAHLDAAAYARSVEALRRLAAAARQAGLTLTGETHANTLFDTVAHCRRVLADVAAPNFKVCFQPFDFTDTAVLLSDYEALHPGVMHVHFQGRNGGDFVLLEHAALDYRAFVDTLAAHDFTGYACIEFVADCVVEDPADFDLPRVLGHAARDRVFLHRLFTDNGMRVRE